MIEPGVHLSFAFFRRLFPLRDADPATAPLSDEERKVFHRWEIAGLVPLFLFTAVLACGWYHTIKWGAALFHAKVPDTRILLLLDPGWWVVPAMLLGLITSALPINAFYYVLLRDRYRRFSRACDERVGFDGLRAFGLLSAVLVAGSLVFFLIGAPCFARFTGKGMEIRRPLSLLTQFYDYSRVRAIEHRATIRAPIGTIVHRPHHVIVFDDGSAWSSDSLLAVGPDDAVYIARLVSRQSGRSIVELPH